MTFINNYFKRKNLHSNFNSFCFPESLFRNLFERTQKLTLNITDMPTIKSTEVPFYFSSRKSRQFICWNVNSSRVESAEARTVLRDWKENGHFFLVLAFPTILYYYLDFLFVCSVSWQSFRIESIPEHRCLLSFIYVRLLQILLTSRINFWVDPRQLRFANEIVPEGLSFQFLFEKKF